MDATKNNSSNDIPMLIAEIVSLGSRLHRHSSRIRTLSLVKHRDATESASHNDE